MSRPTTHHLAFLMMCACSLAAACDEKKPASDGPRADAGVTADKYATADSKLANALQAAASATANDGPPPDGIFAADNADRRHPKGMPTKVELVGDGTEPRVALGTDGGAAADAIPSRSYGPAVLEIAMRLGPRAALPTIDLSLFLGPSKGPTLPAGSDWLAATVRKALPAQQQLADLPADGAREIASLDGTQLLVRLTPDGRESEVQTVLGKEAHPDLERVATNAAEALVLATVPLPSKPVGVGAQWIAETRMPFAGVDVIAYRAFRVKSIDGEKLDIAVDIKAYAASGETPILGVPPGSTLKQFEAEARGEMTAVHGETMARKFEVQEQVVFVFSSKNPPEGQAPADPAGRPEGNTLTGQIQAEASFVRGDELRAAAARARSGQN